MKKNRAHRDTNGQIISPERGNPFAIANLDNPKHNDNFANDDIENKETTA
jgi:hypothetical protein